MTDSNHASQETITLPCDHRYRTSNYFLEDQLRCSEAAADFKSVKDMVTRTPSFCLRSSFRFQTQTVPVRVEP